VTDIGATGSDTDASEHQAFTRRRFGPIPAACEYSGLSGPSLYIEAGRNPGLFRKYGSRTLVDFDMLDAILDMLPVADIKPQDPRVYKLQRKPPRLPGDEHPRRRRRTTRKDTKVQSANP